MQGHESEEALFFLRLVCGRRHRFVWTADAESDLSISRYHVRDDRASLVANLHVRVEARQVDSLTELVAACEALFESRLLLDYDVLDCCCHVAS